MATARGELAVAVLDGKLYAVGGQNDDGGFLRSVERYDLAVGAWEAVAPVAAARTKAFDCLDVVAVVSVLVAPRRGVC